MDARGSLVPAVLMLSALGCVEADGGEGDVALPFDGDAEGEVSDGADGADGPDGEPSDHLAGPLTHVVAGVSVLAERLCDLDGDGVGDNAIADLGASTATLFATALNTMMAGAATDGSDPLLVHFPWVENLDGPSDDDAVMLVLAALDLDEPPDTSDDLSGEEPFHVNPISLDACGEPTTAFRGVRLDDGAIEGGPGAIPWRMQEDLVRVSEALVSGTIAPGGTSSTVRGCGVVPASELGSAELLGPTSGLSILEIVLSGGAAFGIPSLPGITPDVDRDGDGLELFQLSGSGAIEACVDGDRTTIAGRDCWRDERMADAFSLNLEMSGVPAVLAGRLPGWESLVDGVCDAPPETSLFDAR